MSDHTRRSSLEARAKALRQKAEAFRARCADDGAKQLVTQMVLHHIDDVERLLLGESSRNLNPGFAPVWWQGAEQTMGMGEEGLASLEKQFAQFGGPEKVKVIG